MSDKLNPIFKDLTQPETFNKHLNGLNLDVSKVPQKKGLLLIKPANEWVEDAKNRPVPKMLFGQLWYESEICILFADTNLGKSILAVQIADAISSGRGIANVVMEVEPSKVIYYDFELSDKQFENRYSNNYSSHYNFSPNLLRVEIDPEIEIPIKMSYEDFLNTSFEQTIVETGAKILIIDNITYLRGETEKAKDALPLMKQLKMLKSKYDLSLLILAHTPKRDLSKAISRNDLQGSKMLINFCDSSFSIGESHRDSSLRYIKQIKARNTEIIYPSENVLICSIEKPNNFLQFKLIDTGNEQEHLKHLEKKEKDARKLEAKQLKSDGYSNIYIAQKFSVSEGAVRKWFKQMDQDEQESN